MIFYKTEEEIELMRQSCLLVSNVLAEVGKAARPGITTLELDALAEEFIRSHGAAPAFKGYRNFPNTICASVNEQVVHGVPGNYALRDGDVLSVDCGVILNGFYGDSAYTYAIGRISEEKQRLLQVTKEALYKGIEAALAGNRIGDISYAIQRHAESNGYSVVRELVGHGIGKKLHEDPEVPNYGKRGSRAMLQEGLVLAIEPMVNMGKNKVVHGKDGHTVSTADGLPSAHYEHTVAIRRDMAADILTHFDFEEIHAAREEPVL